jgi:hypothetical protein
VTESGPDCVGLHEVAAELALGLLEGTARGEALAHLSTCAPCRAHVQELAEAADQLLALAPEGEPPAGFESVVIGRIEGERGPRVAGHRRRSRLLLAAAAVVLVACGVLAGHLMTDGGGEGDGELAWTSMVAPGGEQVGEVWRYGADEATLVVSVPAWADIDGTDGPRYAVRLALEDGGRVDVGDFALGDGTSSWGLTTPVDAGSITAVSVIDDTGRVWCTGHF